MPPPMNSTPMTPCNHRHPDISHTFINSSTPATTNRTPTRTEMRVMVVTSKFKMMNPNQIQNTPNTTNNHHAQVNDRRSSRASTSGPTATAVIYVFSPCERLRFSLCESNDGR